MEHHSLHCVLLIAYELRNLIEMLLSHKTVSGLCVIIIDNLAVFSSVFVIAFLGIPLCLFCCNMDAPYKLQKPDHFLEKVDKQLMKSVSFSKIVDHRAHGRLYFFCR
jgi:hypothetical protein